MERKSTFILYCETMRANINIGISFLYIVHVQYLVYTCQKGLFQKHTRIPTNLPATVTYGICMPKDLTSKVFTF